MTERAKRLLIIVGFVFIVLVAGFAIWWFFFRPIFVPTPVPVVMPPPISPIPGLPPAAPAAPRPLIPEVPGAQPLLGAPVGPIRPATTLVSAAVLSPFLSADGSAVQYYNRSDGKFYRVRSDGISEAMTDQVFFNVSQVTWAPDKNLALLEYPDSANILYNFQTKRQATLSKHWNKFSFSPRSDGIAFLSEGIDQDSRWLAISAPDGSGSRAIEPLGNNADKVEVAWSPNDQVIAFSRTGFPQGANEQEVLLIGKEGENFRSLIVNGIGFRPKWSPSGEQLLYSATSGNDDFKPQLWIVQGTPGTIGQGKTALGLNTWADKCTFASEQSLYCAVPTELPRGAGLYPAAAATIPDQIWHINLQTGARQLVAVPQETHTVNQLVVPQDEQYLYFTDKISGQLYKIDLK